MDEESNLRCKRSKFMAQSQQCIFFSLRGNPTPLGLTLRKTPSFLNLVETKLSHASTLDHEFIKEDDIYPTEQQTIGKAKASNFSCSLLRIGLWERTSRYEAELVAKCYYAKRKLVWEILDGELKNKIEIPWSGIASLKATFDDGATDTLEIELSCRPTFFQETNPQPRKHTLWKATSDFTGRQASTYRRHFLQFPQGNFRRHYEKLLKSDKRLLLLSKKPYPTLESPFFGSEEAGDQNPSCYQFFKVKEQSLNLPNQSLEQSTVNDYLKNSEHFTRLRTSSILQQLSKLDFPIDFSQATCPSSVINLSSVEAAFSSGSNLLVHNTSSVSVRDGFPSIVGSLLPSASDFSMPVTAKHYPYKKKTQVDDTEKEISDQNIGLLSFEQPCSDAIVNCNGSTVNKDSLLQISEIQADWNLLVPISSCNNVVNNNEVDGLS